MTYFYSYLLCVFCQMVTVNMDPNAMEKFVFAVALKRTCGKLSREMNDLVSTNPHHTKSPWDTMISPGRVTPEPCNCLDWCSVLIGSTTTD